MTAAEKQAFVGEAMKPGELLVRHLITDIDERLKALQAAATAGKLGPRVVRARLRWIHQDYDHLVTVANRWGFKFPLQ